MKKSRIWLSFSSENVAPTELPDCRETSSLGIEVIISQSDERSVIAAKIGKRYCQLPKTFTAKTAIIGPMNDETALTTCPAVSELVSDSPDTTFVSSGLSDTCRIVLPIPSSAKATMQVAKLYDTNGISMPTIVMTLLIWTVRLRPTRFIASATGTESSRNHRNTIEGMNPARASLRLKSFLT
jgi:hypothetical protein